MCVKSAMLFRHPLSFMFISLFRISCCNANLRRASTTAFPRLVSIRASEVAACVGQNRFKEVEDTKFEIWQRSFPSSFSGSTKLDLELEAVERIPDAEKALIEAAAMRPVTSGDEAQSIIAMATARIQASEEISIPDKEKVVSLLTKQVQTGMGIRTEDLIVQSVEAAEQVVMQRDDSFYDFPICVLDNTRYIVRGKIDRLVEENGETVLIEIKSRAKRLFKKLAVYEKIQVQTYLQMLPGVNRARLIEKYGDETHSIDIAKDDEMWRSEVLPALTEFCRDLHSDMKQASGATNK